VGDAPVHEIAPVPTPAFAGQTLAQGGDSNHHQERRQADYNALAIHLKTSVWVLLIR
jgi:hypothetical protein